VTKFQEFKNNAVSPARTPKIQSSASVTNSRTEKKMKASSKKISEIASHTVNQTQEVSQSTAPKIIKIQTKKPL
jgi:hypothetical protein